MTDLTPDEILEAIKRGMEETWRKIDQQNAEKERQDLPLRRLRENTEPKDSGLPSQED